MKPHQGLGKSFIRTLIIEHKKSLSEKTLFASVSKFGLMYLLVELVNSDSWK